MLVGVLVAVPAVSERTRLALKRTTLVQTESLLALALLNHFVVVNLALTLVVVAIAVAAHRH
jgi:hypothetical protein